MKGGIYLILNSINGKFYIGSAINFKIRWAIHKSDLNLNRHSNKVLQHAWNKYWSCNFQFYIIEYVNNKKDLLIREQWWFDLTKCYERKIGYNLDKTAGSPYGRFITLETRAKMSAAKKGRKLTEEQKSIKRGWKLSLETRARMSERMKNFKHSEASKKKMSLIRTGEKRKPMSKEHKAKISAANKTGKWPCPSGNGCLCLECTNKRNEYRKNRRKLLRERK